MDNTIYQEVLKKANIIDVISSYGIKINKNKCLCPFHDDKHPSMSIEPNKQIYKCFSCGESGNAITFVYNYETKVNKNSNFRKFDALKKVVEICKISDIILKDNISTFSSSKDKNFELQNIVKANEQAQILFKYNLKTKEGQKALDYLKARNISDEIIENLGIGFAGNKDILSNQQNMFDYVDAGLIFAEESYKKDIFKDRITFPIYDHNGIIVGFGGRIIDTNKSDIKYLNTKETKLFNKSNILYNYNNVIKVLNSKKEEFKPQRIYLVEGYMDVVGCKKLGIDNVVASMGTALSKEQVKLLKDSNCKISLMRDTDLPGRNAILKDMELLEKAKIEYDIIDLSYGFGEKDIGEISENTPNHLEKKVVEKINQLRVSGFTFKIREYIRRNSISQLNIEEVKDIINYFHITSLQDSLINEFVNEIKDVSVIPEKQIQEIIYPNGKFKAFKDNYFQAHILDLLKNEVQSREILVLSKYFEENKDFILNTVMKIIEKNSDKLINLDKGIIHVSTALNAYLRLDKKYEVYKNLNTFKFPEIFNNIYISKQEAHKINLDNKTKNNLILNLELELGDNLDSTLKDIKEIYIINSVDDLFNILPTKMIDPFTFNIIQHNLFDNHISVFDFNHCFDEEELNKGILDMFDQTYKDESGRLKKIMLLPNIENTIHYSMRKEVSQVLENETLNKGENEQTREILQDISDEFKHINEKGQIEIGCTIDQILFSSYESYHDEKSIFIRVPNSNMKYYIHADRSDITSLNEGKTLFLKMKEDQKFQLYDSKNNKIDMIFTTNELLKYFEIKHQKDTRDYFNVSKSLIREETKEGFYFYSPRDKNTLFYVSKEATKWLNDSKNYLQVFIQPKVMSKYTLNKDTLTYKYEKTVDVAEINQIFRVIKFNNSKEVNVSKSTMPKNILLSFNKNDVDFVTIEDKDYAIVNYKLNNEKVSVRIPQKYVKKETSQNIIFALDSKWKYTLKSETSNKTVTAYELSKIIEKEKALSHEVVEKEV